MQLIGLIQKKYITIRTNKNQTKYIKCKKNNQEEEEEENEQVKDEEEGRDRYQSPWKFGEFRGGGWAHIPTHTDNATYKLNWLRGQFSKMHNNYFIQLKKKRKKLI